MHLARSTAPHRPPANSTPVDAQPNRLGRQHSQTSSQRQDPDPPEMVEGGPASLLRQVAQPVKRKKPEIPAMPQLVEAVIRRGLLERRFLFPEKGPSRVFERWQAPAVRKGEIEAVEQYLVAIDLVLEPAERGELLARILALLSHYPGRDHKPQVETNIAEDWAEDLEGYPIWAVNAAARQWRRTKVWAPRICEIRDLCDFEVGQHLVIKERLQDIVRRAQAGANPLIGKLAAMASSTLGRMPTEAGD